MRKRVTTVVGVAVAAVLVPLASPTGVFAGTLDQSQTTVNDNPDDSSPIGGAFPVQYFTAGLSGALDQVDVYVRRDADCTGRGIRVGIFERMTDEPEVPVPRSDLAHAFIPTDSVPTSFGWVSVAFPSPATVSAGSRYWLALFPDCRTELPLRWGRASGDPYTGGDGYLWKCGFGCAFATGFDHAFKTYVRPPVTRSLTLEYSRKNGWFRGKLAADSAPDCVSDQSVSVFEVQYGDNLTLGSDMSDDRGRFFQNQRNPKGRFYARVEQTTTASGICLAAKSKTIKVGG